MNKLRLRLQVFRNPNRFPSLAILFSQRFLFTFVQEPITRSVHLHCIRDPTCAQTELFLEMCFPQTCLHCGPYMTEINAEKNVGQSAKREAKSRILRPFSSTISLSTMISIIRGPQRRQTFAGNNSKNSSISAYVVSQT